MPNKYSVNPQIISNVYHHIRRRETNEILRTYSYATQNGLMNAIGIFLSSFSRSHPQKIIALYCALQNERLIQYKEFLNTFYWIGSGDILYDAALTCSEAIISTIQNKFDINILERILAINPKQKKIAEMLIGFKEMTPVEVDKAIESIISSGRNSANDDIIAIILNLLVNGIYTEKMNRFLSTADSVFFHNNSKTKNAYSLGGNVATEDLVQKCIETTKKRLLIFANQMTDRNWYSVEEFLNAISHRVDCIKCKNLAVEFASIIDCFKFFHASSRISEPTTEYISNIIHSILLCYVRNGFKAMSKEEYPRHRFCKLQATPFIKTLLSERHMGQDIFIYLNQIRESNIISSCLWAIKFCQIKDITNTLIDDAIQTKPISNAKNTQSLMSRIKELEKKDDHQQAIISGLKKDLAKLKNCPAQSCSNSESLKYQRKYHKAVKNAEKYSKELLEEREKVAALEEKIVSLSKSASNPSECPNVDTAKKYLFVVDDDRLSTRLKSWFPNSVISDHAEVSPRNANNYYMGVFLTSKVTHVTYWYYKEKCVLYNIPIANCNGCGYTSVCSAIQKCERENNLSQTSTGHIPANDPIS